MYNLYSYIGKIINQKRLIRVKYSYEKIIAKQVYTDIRAINNTITKKTGKLNRTTAAEGSVWFSSRSTPPPAYPPNS